MDVDVDVDLEKRCDQERLVENVATTGKRSMKEKNECKV